MSNANGYVLTSKNYIISSWLFLSLLYVTSREKNRNKTIGRENLFLLNKSPFSQEVSLPSERWCSSSSPRL